MIAQGLLMPGNAASPGSDIRPAGGDHVTILALLALDPGRALQPLAVCAVNVNAKDNAFMARGAIATVLVKPRSSIFAAVDVIQRTEKDLLRRLVLVRPQQLQAEPPVRPANATGG